MRFLGKALCRSLLFILLLTGTARGETSVYFAGCDPNSPEYAAFVEMHPDVSVQTESNVYYNTQQVLNGFLTGELPYDVFSMTSQSFDIRLLMEKRYLAPLTAQPGIREALEQMYAPILEQMTYNGEIYGVPYGCSILYHAYSPEAWAEAGLTEADVPDSFAGLLDFLDAWILRMDEQPLDHISVCNAFDEEQYGAHSYILYLVQALVDNHIMQSSYAGEPLRFDTPQFRELLTRCQAIGQKLYALEPVQKGQYALLEEQSTLNNLRYCIPLRLTEEQPALIKASVTASFVNVRTSEPELAMDFLTLRLRETDPQTMVYLYPHAQPVENENQKVLMESLSEVIAGIQSSLAADNLSEDERRSLTERLEEKQAQYDQIADPTKRYEISPEEIAVYQTYGPQLYFQPPSVFDPSTEDGQNVRQLEERFAHGSLDADTFIREMDRLAWMLENEGA